LDGAWGALAAAGPATLRWKAQHNRARIKKGRVKKFSIALSSSVLHPSKDIEMFGDHSIDNLMMFIKDGFGKGPSICASCKNPMILLYMKEVGSIVKRILTGPRRTGVPNCMRKRVPR
jgi:hypothetical protein